MGEKRPATTERPSFAPEADSLAFSNAIRLTAREWLGVATFTLAMILFAPSVWMTREKLVLEHEHDYRIPYDLSADYWLYDRYARLAAGHYDTLVFGDSVVWGEYVTRQQTLTHYLNEQAGKERFANLGLDGAHPAALEGLVEHYSGGISGKNVVLQCNPLWLSSPRQALPTSDGAGRSTKRAFELNHPRLVPQFKPPVPFHNFLDLLRDDQGRAELSQRIGVVVEEHAPFSSWASHIQQAYFARKDIPSWTLEHPYAVPLGSLREGLPPSDNQLRHEPIPWMKRGIQKQAFNWVDPRDSLQWRSFQRAVEVLEKRGNHVFVLVGPFNEHVLNEKGMEAYQSVKSVIVGWLKERGIPHAVPEVLPSERYGDSSHPLSAGYELLAKRIIDQLPRE
jgi:hypothetical protein